MATMIAVMLCNFSDLKAQDERLNSFTKENIFKVSLGPSIMTSKIIMPVYSYLGGNGVTGSLRMKRLIGIDVAATYQHLWRKGFGVGLDYVLGHTFMAQSYGQIDQHYIGPSFVYSYRGWERFSTNVAVGLSSPSYSYYTHNNISDSILAPYILDIANSADVSWGPSSTSNISKARNAFINWGYSLSAAQDFNRTNVINSLLENLPVYCRGSGHAWVIDGYSHTSFIATYYELDPPHNQVGQETNSGNTFYHCN